MKIFIYNSHAEIEGNYPEGFIDEVLTVEHFIYARWDPVKRVKHLTPRKMSMTQCFFEDDTFPAGAVGLVVDWLEDKGYTVEVFDRREFPKIMCEFPGGLNAVPRYYQEDAFNELLDRSRGVFVVPTGGGKTLISQMLINALCTRTLYVVPGVELVRQALKDFSNFGEIGVTVGELKDIKNPFPINVCTVAKLWYEYKTRPASFRQFARDIGLLIGDEIHHLTYIAPIKGKKYKGGSWLTLFNAIPAYYKFGCSATPGDKESLSYRSLQFGIGRVAYSVTYKELRDRGYLSAIDVHMYQTVIENDSYDWIISLDNLMASEKFTKLIVKVARKYHKQNKSVVIMVDRIVKQAKVIYELLPEAELVHGGSTRNHRKDVMERLVNGEKMIVISSVYKEGVDIPPLDVVMVTNGVGEQIITQKVGRLSRIWGDKNKGILIDFYHADGHLLELHSKKREEQYKKAGFTIQDFVKC